MSTPIPGDVSPGDREAARLMLGRVADRCEKLGAALGANGIPGISIRALMARPVSAVSAADLVHQPPGLAAVQNPRTPLGALTVQILRIAASAEPADRKDRELRQLAARIAALPPQGTGIIDPDPDPPARLSPAQRQVLAATAAIQPARITEVAEDLPLSRSAVAAALRGLERRRLALAGPPLPGTSTRAYTLTPAGQRALGDQA